MHHPLVSVLIAFVLGILVGERLSFSPGRLWILLLVILGSTLVLIGRSQRRPGHALLLGAVFLAGALRYQLSAAILDPLHYLNAPARLEGTFKVVLSQNPEARGETLVFYGDLLSVARNQEIRGLTGRVRIRPPREEAQQIEVKEGDILRLDGRLVPTTVVLPWADRVGALDRRRGIHGELRVDGTMQLVGHRPLGPFRALAMRARQHVLKLLEQTHPPEVTEFVQAVLLGSRLMSEDRRRDFRHSGAYHILAVSGLHVGILAMVLMGFLGVLPLSRGLQASLAIAGLAFYCLMVGGTASVLRATLMASIYLLGRVLDRPITLITSLATAAVVILFHDPLNLYDPGFQLTILTTASLIYLTPAFMTRLEWLPPHINSLLSASLAATLGSLPIMVDSFGLLVPVGPLTNLVAIPLFGVILPVAFLASLGGFLSPWISFFFGALNYGFINLLFFVVQTLASLPGAYLEVGPMGLSFWGAYGFALVVVGDLANLKSMIRSLASRAAEPVVPILPEGIPGEVVERTARELRSLLPTEDDPAEDEISRRLAALRSDLEGQLPHLSAEFVKEYSWLLRQPWRRSLDTMTVAWLSLSSAHFIASRSRDKSPSVLFLLRALEHELNVHLFRPMRTSLHVLRAQGLREKHADHPLVSWLAGPPSSLSLVRQNDLLWAMITTSEPRLQRLVRSITRDLSRRVTDVPFFFSPSRLPLRLDQTLKKFYQRLEKETWDWERVRMAREEILGPRQVSMFKEIGDALGEGDGQAGSWLKGVMALETSAPSVFTPPGRGAGGDPGGEAAGESVTDSNRTPLRFLPGNLP